MYACAVEGTKRCMSRLSISCGFEARSIARAAMMNVRMMNAVWRDIENFLEVEPSLCQYRGCGFVKVRNTIEISNDLELNNNQNEALRSLRLRSISTMQRRRNLAWLNSRLLGVHGRAVGYINMEGSSLLPWTPKLSSNGFHYHGLSAPEEAQLNIMVLNRQL